MSKEVLMFEEKIPAYTIAATDVPPRATFKLKLTRLYKGSIPALLNARCRFTYIWDFEKNTGLAHLISIDHCPVNIVLHTMGVEGALDFMSDIAPKTFDINGEEVIINKVILNIDPDTNERKAAILFHKNGECIETTENY